MQTLTGSTEIHVEWERRPEPKPCSYWTTDGRWVIMPEIGGHGWELCDIEEGGGMSLWRMCDTVREAKHEVERQYRLEASRR